MTARSAVLANRIHIYKVEQSILDLEPLRPSLLVVAVLFGTGATIGAVGTVLNGVANIKSVPAARKPKD